MAKAPIANQIDKNIFLECLPVLHRYLHNFAHQLRLICIHMNYWCLNRFGHIRAVETSPRFCRSRCEPDLIISYHMDYPMVCIMVQISHLETFIDDALSSQSSITVDQHTHHFVPVLSLVVH